MNSTITILDGSTFCVSDRCGNIAARPDQPEGFFFRDMRHLSRWRLSIGGRDPVVLSADEREYFAASFFLVPPDVRARHPPQVSLIRKRFIGEGFREELTVINHGGETVDIELRLDVEADFADIFEIKDALEKAGSGYARVEQGSLLVGYRRDGFVRETRVTASGPAELDESGLTFRLSVPPRSDWSTTLTVEPLTGDRIAGRQEGGSNPDTTESLRRWLESAPALETDWSVLEQAYRRSLVDLAALRFYPLVLEGVSLPAGGLPWFMTLFGRDSLITSYQTLPFLPELAAATLRVLAARQGTKIDEFRDEEPGRILHELRFGELAHFEERPQSPYYGSSDATPLFLIVLDEYERWTGDADLVRELEPQARAALDWIDGYGDRDGDGFVEYETRNPETGLENQCWKDSWNSILFADGSLAKPPIATCEIQGYVYDAKLRCARLARELWADDGLADRLETEAATLRARFAEAFWIPDGEFYALALDRDKRQVDALTSNIGHLLWSGIVDESRAPALRDHLCGNDLFSGWGVRTMAASQGGYSPIEYHNGTVWPHDNSLIAAGLGRYGFRDDAARLARSLLDAAPAFRHRLPEVFAGYPRELTGYPVEYPTACTLQAWAAGAPFLLLRVMLGLDATGDAPTTDPVLPGGVSAVQLRQLPWRGARIDAV